MAGSEFNPIATNFDHFQNLPEEQKQVSVVDGFSLMRRVPDLASRGVGCEEISRYSVLLDEVRS